MSYSVTERSLAKLHELVREAGVIARSVRDSGPVDVRYEATNLVAGIGNVSELLRDLDIALAMAEANGSPPMPVCRSSMPSRD
jgi:DNA-binding HxlR family transcriptional regulator